MADNLQIKFLEIRYDKIKTFANLLLGFAFSVIALVISMRFSGNLSTFVSGAAIIYIFVFALVAYVIFSKQTEKLITRTEREIAGDKDGSK